MIENEEKPKLIQTPEPKKMSVINRITTQILFCTLIILCILIVKNVKNTEEVQETLKTELMHQVSSAEVKNTINDIINDAKVLMSQYNK